ncbi:MAG TPA: hypothetical protein VF186_05910 [Gaiellaceae bacterium]
MSLPKLKAFLTLLMAIGAAAFFGSGGTFASFSAETTNAGSTAASGTLTMSNTVGTGSACATASAASQNNFNEACSPALTLTNLAPGTYGGAASITIQNTGSIDASALSLWAPPVNATLDAALTNGVTSGSSLTVTALEGTVTSGDSIVVSFGTHTQTFVASGSASGGATSIPITAQTANYAYPVGSIVQDTSSNTTASNTDCYDVKTTVAGTTGATKGTDLDFNPTTGNPLCAAALLYVQEQTGGFNYCWFGNSSNAPTGGCTAPISVTPSSALSTSGAITTIGVSALNGNVKKNDTIRIVSGNNTQDFTANADAYIGATSLTIVSATPNFAYPTTSTITDTTVQNTLNPDQADTISKFDTLHNGSSGKIPLYPLTANGTASTTAPVALAHSATRTFYVGVYLPGPPANNQNPLQGLSSTFGLTWHLDQ